MNEHQGREIQRKVSYLPDTHRLLPQSPDAERALLGSYLLSPREVGEMCDEKGVTAEWFFIPSHAEIFDFCEAIRAGRKKPASETNPHAPVALDFITLTQVMRDEGRIDQCGGAAFVTELFTFLPTAVNAAYYLEILLEKLKLRQIIKVGTEYAARAYEEQDQVPELLEGFQVAVVELGDFAREAETLRLVTNAEIIARIENAEERYKKRGKLAGLSTGIADLDRMLDGLQGKHVYTFAGRPAMGKSAFGENIWEHVCLNAMEETGLPAAYFSVEMPREQLIDRALLGRARLNLGLLRNGFMGQDDFVRLQKSAQELARGKMIIDDTPGLTIAQFRAKARKAVVKMKARLIVIDYVQIMKGSSKRAGENRVLELTEIMQGIRETAKQLDVPIIVLAQLNRGAEERPGAVPTMADLKECGAIEEESNVVGLLYREPYYAKTDEKLLALAKKYQIPVANPAELSKAELAEINSIAKVIIAKQRNGPVGPVELKFHGPFTRFEGVTKKLWSNNQEE